MKNQLVHVPAAVRATRRPDAKLMIVDRKANSIEVTSLNKLPAYLHPRDLIVANDAATLPASFRGVHGPSGQSIEMRLLRGHGGFSRRINSGLPNRWTAILLDSGNRRQKSEDRTSTPPVAGGDSLYFGDKLQAILTRVDPEENRWIQVDFQSPPDRLWFDFYKVARPIQYFYHHESLGLWDVQTAFASRPIALEAPSSALHFDSALIEAIKSKAHMVTVTHGTGVSATGAAHLDQRLPLAETFHFTEKSTQKLQEHLQGQTGRIIAIGTGVARALESWDGHRGWGETALKIDGHHDLKKVNSILTGMHEPDSSHWQLLQAFAPEDLLYKAFFHAKENGFLWHEFGDLMWIR